MIPFQRLEPSKPSPLLPHHASILGCLIALAAAPTGPARAQAIVFPPDWTITDLPAAMPDGHQVDGGARRAMLKDAAGAFLAAIELTSLPQPPGRVWDKAEAMRSTQDAAGEIVRKAGLAYTCDAATPVRVAAVDGLLAECQIRRAGAALVRQRIAVWSQPGMLSSLSYSSSVGHFAAHESAFAQVLGSIKPE